MAALLSPAEQRILEATCEPQAAGELTGAVRRTLGQLPGPDFRRGVASLAERGLLRARVTTKVDGDIGRVVIEGITPLGLSIVRRRGRGNVSLSPSAGSPVDPHEQVPAEPEPGGEDEQAERPPA